MVTIFNAAMPHDAIRKIERIALQNAASIAGLLLTTEAAIMEIKEKKKSGGHDHSHDDMDY